MTETYVSLGWPADWRLYVPLGLFVIATPFVMNPLAKRIGKPMSPMAWSQIGWGLWMVFGSLAALPLSWMMIPMPLCFGIAMLFPAKGISTLQRLVMAPIFFALTWWFATMDIHHQKITLRSDRADVSETWRQSPQTLPRNGLEVRVLHDVKTDEPGRYGWLVDLADHSRIGPMGIDFSSKDIFWGPQGMVKGNQLGNHIADWAGVKPVYENYSL